MGLHEFIFSKESPSHQDPNQSSSVSSLLRSISGVCWLYSQAQVSHTSSPQCHSLRCLSACSLLPQSGTSPHLNTPCPPIKQPKCWYSHGPQDVQSSIFILKLFWVYLSPFLRSMPSQLLWVTLAKKEITPLLSTMGLVSFYGKKWSLDAIRSGPWPSYLLAIKFEQEPLLHWGSSSSSVNGNHNVYPPYPLPGVFWELLEKILALYLAHSMFL